MVILKLALRPQIGVTAGDGWYVHVIVFFRGVPSLGGGLPQVSCWGDILRLGAIFILVGIMVMSSHIIVVVSAQWLTSGGPATIGAGVPLVQYLRGGHLHCHAVEIVMWAPGLQCI